MRLIGLENYYIENDKVVRELKVGTQTWRSSIENRADASAVGYAAWWQSFLRGATVFVEESTPPLPPLRTVDAFCGCGGT